MGGSPVGAKLFGGFVGASVAGINDGKREGVTDGAGVGTPSTFVFCKAQNNSKVGRREVRGCVDFYFAPKDNAQEQGNY